MFQSSPAEDMIESKQLSKNLKKQRTTRGEKSTRILPSPALVQRLLRNAYINAFVSMSAFHFTSDIFLYSSLGQWKGNYEQCAKRLSQESLLTSRITYPSVQAAPQHFNNSIQLCKNLKPQSLISATSIPTNTSIHIIAYCILSKFLTLQFRFHFRYIRPSRISAIHQSTPRNYHLIFYTLIATCVSLL